MGSILLLLYLSSFMDSSYHHYGTIMWCLQFSYRFGNACLIISQRKRRWLEWNEGCHTLCNHIFWAAHSDSIFALKHQLQNGKDHQGLTWYSFEILGIFPNSQTKHTSTLLAFWLPFWRRVRIPIFITLSGWKWLWSNLRKAQKKS